MEPQERLAVYEQWLINNPEHPDYLFVWQLRRELETKKSKTYENN